MRSRRDLRFRRNFPRSDLPQMKVNPKKCWIQHFLGYVSSALMLCSASNSLEGPALHAKLATHKFAGVLADIRNSQRRFSHGRFRLSQKDARIHRFPKSALIPSWQKLCCLQPKSSLAARVRFNATANINGKNTYPRKLKVSGLPSPRPL